MGDADPQELDIIIVQAGLIYFGVSRIGGVLSQKSDFFLDVSLVL